MKNEKKWKNGLLQKKVWKEKSLKSLKKNVYDCGNKMLSSIALKNGSCVESCVKSLSLTPSF